MVRSKTQWTGLDADLIERLFHAAELVAERACHANGCWWLRGKDCTCGLINLGLVLDECRAVLARDTGR